MTDIAVKVPVMARIESMLFSAGTLSLGTSELSIGTMMASSATKVKVEQIGHKGPERVGKFNLYILRV